MSVFSTVPGYAGFYGPSTGTNVTVAFGRSGQKMNSDINNGFFCDQYQINWNRPSQAKRFLNVKRPVAIVGFGTGTLTLTGLLGTYDGFKALVSSNTVSTAEDVCKPLFCLITPANNFAACADDMKGSASHETVQWKCDSLMLASINVTGQIQDNGVMFQQANVVFTMGGLEPKRWKGDAATDPDTEED